MPQRKEKRVTPKRFRPATSKPTTACASPYQRPQLNPKLMYQIANPQLQFQFCKSNPWPGTGKMSGNLFEDRNWLPPSNYLDNANENKTENEHKIATDVTSPRPPIKEYEEPKINETVYREVWLGTRLPLL